MEALEAMSLRFGHIVIIAPSWAMNNTNLKIHIGEIYVRQTVVENIKI